MNRHTKLQWFSDVVAFIPLMVMFVMIIAMWNDLPNEVPAHYNAQGIIDRMGDKSEIWIMPITGAVLFVLLTLVSYIPMKGDNNKLTDIGRKKLANILMWFMIVSKLVMTLTFMGLTIYQICGIQIDAWFMPAEIIAIFGSAVAFVILIFLTIHRNSEKESK